jgi:hypothetical protein
MDGKGQPEGYTIKSKTGQKGSVVLLSFRY